MIQGSNGQIQENGGHIQTRTVQAIPTRQVRPPQTTTIQRTTTTTPVAGQQPTRLIVQKTPQGTQNRAQPRRQLYPVNQPRYIGDTFVFCYDKNLKIIVTNFVYPSMLQSIPRHGPINQSGAFTRSKNCNKSD